MKPDHEDAVGRDRRAAPTTSSARAPAERRDVIDIRGEVVLVAHRNLHVRARRASPLSVSRRVAAELGLEPAGRRRVRDRSTPSSCSSRSRRPGGSRPTGRGALRRARAPAALIVRIDPLRKLDDQGRVARGGNPHDDPSGGWSPPRPRASSAIEQLLMNVVETTVRHDRRPGRRRALRAPRPRRCRRPSGCTAHRCPAPSDRRSAAPPRAADRQAGVERNTAGRTTVSALRQGAGEVRLEDSPAGRR